MAEFARGAQIQLSGRGPVIRLVLPEAVYTTVTRPDLADIRVFNRAGDAVPHALRHAPAPRAVVATLVGAAVLPAPPGESPDENLLTQVAVGPGGAIVEVRGGHVGDATTVVAYLLDSHQRQAAGRSAVARLGHCRRAPGSWLESDVDDVQRPHAVATGGARRGHRTSGIRRPQPEAGRHRLDGGAGRRAPLPSHLVAPGTGQRSA